MPSIKRNEACLASNAPCALWQPYVASLAVSHAHRRRGIAQQLMHAAEELAQEWGYNAVLLEVAQSNERALRFYRRRGYRMVHSDCVGTGATQVRVRAFWWELTSEQKFVMRRDYIP